MKPPHAPKPLDDRPAEHGHRLPAAPGLGFRPTGDAGAGTGRAIATPSPEKRFGPEERSGRLT